MVCISLYKTVPSAPTKANFLLGSRQTGAREEGFLAGGGREKNRHFSIGKMLLTQFWSDPKVLRSESKTNLGHLDQGFGGGCEHPCTTYT